MSGRPGESHDLTLQCLAPSIILPLEPAVCNPEQKACSAPPRASCHVASGASATKKAKFDLIIDSRLDKKNEGPLEDLTDKDLGRLVRGAMQAIAEGDTKGYNEAAAAWAGEGGEIWLKERATGWKLIIEEPPESEEAD